MRFVLKHKISQELARQVVRSDKSDMFEYGVEMKMDPTFVAWFLTSALSHVKTKDNAPIEKITDAKLKDVLKILKTKKMTRESVLELLKELANNPEKKPEELIKTEYFSEINIERIIKKAIKENPNVLKKHNPEKILMGIVMKEVRGKVPGSDVSKALAKELKKK